MSREDGRAMRGKEKVRGRARDTARCVLPAKPTLSACPGHFSWAGSTATGRVWHGGTKKREASAPQPQDLTEIPGAVGSPWP